MCVTKYIGPAAFGGGTGERFTGEGVSKRGM